jgi:hypothetical protein
MSGPRQLSKPLWLEIPSPFGGDEGPDSQRGERAGVSARTPKKRWNPYILAFSGKLCKTFFSGFAALCQAPPDRARQSRSRRYRGDFDR